MLRISKLTDYATVILGVMARGPAALFSAAEIAERTRIGLPTVSKLLKELQRAGLVTSARGSRGGYQLAREPAAITAAAIIDAVEGPVALTECAAYGSHCEIEASCGVGGAWQRVNAAIRRALDDVNLNEAVACVPRLPAETGASGWRPLSRL
jgi:FeS assembly SUF system regulator